MTDPLDKASEILKADFKGRNLDDITEEEIANWMRETFEKVFFDEAISSIRQGPLTSSIQDIITQRADVQGITLPGIQINIGDVTFTCTSGHIDDEYAAKVGWIADRIVKLWNGYLGVSNASIDEEMDM